VRVGPLWPVTANFSFSFMEGYVFYFIMMIDCYLPRNGTDQSGLDLVAVLIFRCYWCLFGIIPRKYATMALSSDNRGFLRMIFIELLMKVHHHTYICIEIDITLW
jgi:hypothetical protein